MRTIKLKKFEKVVRETVEVLRAGGLVVFPSDTVYGLAVEATSQRAVDKLLKFKDRFTGKAISVMVADEKMARDYVELSGSAKNIYKNLLPGPFTVISKGKHKVAKGVEAENGTLGIRIPDNKLMRELARKLRKPITATSANLAGKNPCYSVGAFWKQLSKKKRGMVDLVIDGGKLPNNKPSTVIDSTEPEIKVLRRGDLVTGSARQTLVSKSEKETGKIAEFFMKRINPSPTPPLTRRGIAIVIGLSGDLGCGKTVFARAIGKYLGVKEKINSTTFVIMNEYEIPLPPRRASPFEERGTKKFLHFDLYRINSQYELEEIKFLEQFTPGTVSCIEWPENMGKENLEKLKKATNYVSVNLEYVDEETREIKMESK